MLRDEVGQFALRTRLQHQLQERVLKFGMLTLVAYDKTVTKRHFPYFRKREHPISTMYAHNARVPARIHTYSTYTHMHTYIHTHRHTCARILCVHVHILVHSESYLFLLFGTRHLVLILLRFLTMLFDTVLGKRSTLIVEV